MMAPLKPPVVLLGGLNVVRALGLAGIPVVVASHDDDEPGLHSRYCVLRWSLPPLTAPEAVVQSLERLAQRLRRRWPARCPLFFSNDESLQLVYRFRDRLEASFNLVLNDDATAAALLDKGQFARLAAKLALPVPRAFAWDELEAWDGPVLAKPASKFGWAEDRALGSALAGAKGVIRPSGRAAREDAALGRSRNNLVFHQYVEGGDDALWCFDGVADASGVVLASHTGRKLRCSPPLAGDSSYIELAHNPELTALARKAAAALGLRGIFNMDFKRDAASGRYYLLEVNARCNLWLYIGARNGLNLAEVLYRYQMHGERPGALSFRTRYRWLDFKLDRAAYRALAAEGKMRRGQWLRSYLAPKIYSVFAWRDPRPFARMWSARLRKRAARGWKAALSKAG